MRRCKDAKDAQHMGKEARVEGKKKPAYLAACGLKSNSRELEETGRILPNCNCPVPFILVITVITLSYNCKND
jgi:hypothetical protein